MVDKLALLERMVTADFHKIVPEVNEAIPALMLRIEARAGADCSLATKLAALEAAHQPRSEVLVELATCLNQVKEREGHFDQLQGKVPSLCRMVSLSGLANLSQAPVRRASAVAAAGGGGSKRKGKQGGGAQAAQQMWDTLMYQMHRTSHLEISKALQSFATECKERCVKDLQEGAFADVQVILETLAECKRNGLDSTFEADEPCYFEIERQTVVDAVKERFEQVRVKCDVDIRADEMANAEASVAMESGTKGRRDARSRTGIS